jgi:hypothetical protein
MNGWLGLMDKRLDARHLNDTQAPKGFISHRTTACA